MASGNENMDLSLVRWPCGHNAFGKAMDGNPDIPIGYSTSCQYNVVGDVSRKKKATGIMFRKLG
jgi:hypothetical protein